MIFIKGGAKAEHKRVNSGFGTQRTRAAQVLIITAIRRSIAKSIGSK